MTIEDMKRNQRYSDEILGIIDNQDSFTRSDLQGVVDAIVQRIVTHTDSSVAPLEEFKGVALYRLSVEDILVVAHDLGIEDSKITPEVVHAVVRMWGNGLDWYEVTKIALVTALSAS